MKEMEPYDITEYVIQILASVPNGITPGDLLKSLTGAIGIAIAGTAKNINDDEMYESFVEVIKEFAQREGAREIFNSLFRAEVV